MVTCCVLTPNHRLKNSFEVLMKYNGVLDDVPIVLQIQTLDGVVQVVRDGAEGGLDIFSIVTFHGHIYSLNGL